MNQLPSAGGGLWGGSGGPGEEAVGMMGGGVKESLSELKLPELVRRTNVCKVGRGGKGILGSGQSTGKGMKT